MTRKIKPQNPARRTMTNKAELKTVKEIRDYLENVLLEIKGAPPDTRFLLGFYASLAELERMTNPAGYYRPARSK